MKMTIPLQPISDADYENLPPVPVPAGAKCLACDLPLDDPFDYLSVTLRAVRKNGDSEARNHFIHNAPDCAIKTVQDAAA